MERPWLHEMQGREQTRVYDRRPSGGPYNTNRWHKLSARLRATPDFACCAECKKKGRYVPATCVDHIVPWPVCGEEGFWDESNLQPLCDKCNNDKGQRDKKRIQEWRKSHAEAEPEGRAIQISRANRG